MNRHEIAKQVLDMICELPGEKTIILSPGGTFVMSPGNVLSSGEDEDTCLEQLAKGDVFVTVERTLPDTYIRDDFPNEWRNWVVIYLLAIADEGIDSLPVNEVEQNCMYEWECFGAQDGVLFGEFTVPEEFQSRAVRP